MNPDYRCRKLAEEIDRLLRQGMTLDSHVMSFIDSTFSYPTADQLRHILTDESDPERESLLNLIFSPDESIRIELENLLETEDFSRDDPGPVAHLLISIRPEIAVHLPGSSEPIHLPMSEADASGFVSRLRIFRKIDPRIAEAVNTHIEENERQAVKVRFRNRRADYTERQVRFLCLFFERMNTKSIGFSDCLELVLSLLDELGEDKDMYPALIGKKQFYFKSIQQAGRFDEQLKKSNIEIMMLQGVRAPYVNKDEATKKMRLIDRICISVFGRTEVFDEQVRSIDYGDIEDAHDMGNIVKLLS